MRNNYRQYITSTCAIICTFCILNSDHYPQESEWGFADQETQVLTRIDRSLHNIKKTQPRRLAIIYDFNQWPQKHFGFSNRTVLTIGVVLTIFGSAIMAGGSTLMKLGLNLNAESRLPSDNRITFVPSCEPIWWSGFASYTIGSLLHVVALGFAPASVLAPMNSFGLLANAIAAATILKESYSWAEGISTTGMIIGVTLCACSSLIHNESSDSDSLIKMSDSTLLVGMKSWRDPWYLSYLGVCVLAGFATKTYINNEENHVIVERERLLKENDDTVELKNIGRNSVTPLPDFTFAEDQSYEDIEITTKGIKKVHLDQNIIPVYSKGVGLAYGFLAGLVGAQCVLQLKEFIEFIQYSISNPDIWHSTQPYLCLLFLVVAVWMQMYFLNLGLARCDSTLVVPSYYIFWTFFGTFGGFAKFHEFDGFSIGEISIFLMGFLITVFCIMTLAVQEMNILRKFVDERVPDIPEDQMDLRTQELHDEQLGKQVSLSMGLFPFSMLGRAIGRKRFRPIYQRFRRTRSTVSDTALGENYALSVSNSRDMTYTLPYSLRFKAMNPQFANMVSLTCEHGVDLKNSSSFQESSNSIHLVSFVSPNSPPDSSELNIESELKQKHSKNNNYFA